MMAPTTWLKAYWQAGRDPAGPACAPSAEHANAVPAVVPIRSLGEAYRGRIAAHLLTLDAEDRYLRFGFAASDEQVQRYVDQLDFERDEIFGIYNRRLELIAMAHLAYAADPAARSAAEFGVSVLRQARGKGLGARLFDRAVMSARNEGVSTLFIHALSENTAMLKIARKAGAVVQRDGSESEAYLTLPAASLDSRVAEIVEQQFAEMDYRFKVQSKHFWDLMHRVHGARRGRHATVR
ncbi:MAG: GNAT family N-acetyltransferase [Curvibacter sp.]|nr:GNAT family N-acetyltransferase [Curvibacter sp.]